MAHHVIEPSPPGLSEGETAFRLDDGTMIAVAVRSEWLPNGEGMVGIVRSRWIDSEGATQNCPNDRPVAIETRHTFSSSYVERFDPDLLIKQLVLLALGEDLDVVEHVNPDRTTYSAPVVDFGAEGRSQGSMKRAVAMVKKSTKRGDAARLLAVKAPPPKAVKVK